MHVLLIEDDQQLCEHLSVSLKQQGFTVTSLGRPEELDGLLNESSNTMRRRQQTVPAEPYSVVVLDRLLGTFDTKQFLPRLKAHWPEIPVVVVSAISTPDERTDLLNLGADDYIGKPFSTAELVARLRVVQRRLQKGGKHFVRLGNTQLDVMKRVIAVADSSAALPAKEFLLMQVLCEQPGRVWNRSDLLQAVWSMDPSSETNVVEATVTNLRRRLVNLSSNLEIRNIRNAGYWIEE